MAYLLANWGRRTFLEREGVGEDGMVEGAMRIGTRVKGQRECRGVGRWWSRGAPNVCNNFNISNVLCTRYVCSLHR